MFFIVLIAFMMCVIAIFLIPVYFILACLPAAYESLQKIAEPRPIAGQAKFLLDVFLRNMRRMMTFLVGDNWKDPRGGVWLALIYWVVLPSVCIGLYPTENRKPIVHSGFLALSLHIWIWANFLGDFFSFHVTRYCIAKLENTPHPSFWFPAKVGISNFFVTIAMLLAVVFFTNLAYLIQMKQDWQGIKDEFQIVFEGSTIRSNYSPVTDNQPVESGFPWMLLIACITFIIPSLWIGMLALLWGHLFVQKLAGLITNQMDKPPKPAAVTMVTLLFYMVSGESITSATK